LARDHEIANILAIWPGSVLNRSGAKCRSLSTATAWLSGTELLPTSTTAQPNNSQNSLGPEVRHRIWIRDRFCLETDGIAITSHVGDMKMSGALLVLESFICMSDISFSTETSI
tara:strand:- start:152 stop:493 length:342 start_codon:yes stop_codon:yes gene_type:complete